MTSDRSEVRDPDSRAMMAGDAEVAFERREHLDLAWQNCALDLAMRMNRKAVLRPDALPHLAACDFALADLRARPSRGLSFSGAQDELGRGIRRQPSSGARCSRATHFAAEARPRAIPRWSSETASRVVSPPIRARSTIALTAAEDDGTSWW